jgi:hypothetical protein
MLNVTKILKRAWQILWNYRMLWVFGFILALTVGAGGNSFSNNNSSRNDRQENGQERPWNLHPSDDWNWEGLKGETPGEKLNEAFRQAGVEIQKLQAKYPVEFRMGIAVFITALVMILIFSFIGAILRYIAETAAIRMVNEYEQSGVKVGFRQGWQYGWSREAWRVFLINFVVHIPSLVLFVILGVLGWWIVSAALSGVESTLVTSLIAGIGLAFVSILITAVLMVVLYLLRDFAWRMTILEGTGVLESLRLATTLVKRNWKSAGLMWLVMIGIKIAWGIAFIILVIPLLIVSIITALGGIVVAVVPTLLTAGVASLLSAPDYWPWIFALIIGLPFFATVAFSPILLVDGWAKIYESSTWTLTYRELKALETVTSTVVEAQ